MEPRAQFIFLYQTTWEFENCVVLIIKVKYVLVLHLKFIWYKMTKVFANPCFI